MRLWTSEFKVITTPKKFIHLKFKHDEVFILYKLFFAVAQMPLADGVLFACIYSTEHKCTEQRLQTDRAMELWRLHFYRPTYI